MNEIGIKRSTLSSLTSSFSGSFLRELNTKLSKSEMTATAIKLKTMSWVVSDYKMTSMFTVSTETVIKLCKKPIRKAFW